MSRSFGNIYTSKKCNCDISNWVKYKTKNSYRRPDANFLIHCKKCQAQWYSKAKYVEKLPYGK